MLADESATHATPKDKWVGQKIMLIYWLSNALRGPQCASFFCCGSTATLQLAFSRSLDYFQTRANRTDENRTIKRRQKTLRFSSKNSFFLYFSLFIDSLSLSICLLISASLSLSLKITRLWMWWAGRDEGLLRRARARGEPSGRSAPGDDGAECDGVNWRLHDGHLRGPQLALPHPLRPPPQRLPVPRAGLRHCRAPPQAPHQVLGQLPFRATPPGRRLRLLVISLSLCNI